MPLLTNAERKNDFLADIGRMFSENGIFTQGKSNTDFVKVFTDVRNYFARKSDENSQKLTGYVQNFINVYEQLQQTNGEANNEHTNEMLTNIASMQKNFKGAFNQYISANKYTALKNSNVKMLSAMVQVADNMGHRVEMEERSESIEFIAGQIGGEKLSNSLQQREYASFIEECDKNDVDFVDPVNTYVVTLNKFNEAQKKFEHWNKLHNELAADPQLDNSKELKEIDDCAEQLREYEKTMNAASERATQLDTLKYSFKSFRQANAESKKLVEEYEQSIEQSTLQLKENEDKIREAQRQVASLEKSVDRVNELINSNDVVTLDRLNEDLDLFKGDLELINHLKDSNITPKMMADPNDPLGKLYRTGYREAKERLCDKAPQLQAEFDKLENNPEATFADFLKKNNNSIMGISENINSEISELSKSKDVKEYKALSDVISSVKSNTNNIETLSAENKKLQADIEKKKNLITATKLESNIAQQIKDTLGFDPKVKTEKELFDIMDKERKTSLDKVKEMQSSTKPAKLKDQMREARQRMEDRNADKIEKNYLTSKKAYDDLKVKLDAADRLSRRRAEIKQKTDRMVDRRQYIKDNSPQYKRIEPNQEVYDRLKGIQERFNIKTNGKMNKECEAMMNKLQNAMDAFDPKNKENYSAEDQRKVLEDLQDLSGKYITAKKAQHIPTWIASEQRLLRLSCAEEMQDFAKTAQTMMSDIEKNNDFESATRYMARECDNKLKLNIDDMNLQIASGKAKVKGGTSMFASYLHSRNQRLKQNEQPNLSNENPQTTKEKDNAYSLS